MPVITGLSGNEMYCLHLKGFAPGNIVIGNSVYSMGFLGGLKAGLRSMVGGEVPQVTQIVHEGRLQSFNRMMHEAQQHGGAAVTGVSSELRHFQGNVEFLSVGSTIHPETEAAAGPSEGLFSSSADGQEFYCQIDAGYQPLKFVFGNIAYSIGVGGGILGTLKRMGRGEIKEYSDVFNATRHHCLERIAADALAAGGNAVVGIETTVMPFQGCHEMMMMGTASHNPHLPAMFSRAPVTSDLTCQELWNMTRLGYAPLKLVLGTGVYSLGIVGGVMAALKSLARGEVSELTSLIYDAREHALGLIAEEATAIGADDVVGIKTHIHELGGLLEFMAIGTAVKRMPDIATASEQLPPQAIIQDKDTWTSDQDAFGLASLVSKRGSGD
jgi:uncharacterized protein YbjQ (UPF0145 family)